MAEIRNHLGVDIGATFADAMPETPSGAFATKMPGPLDARECAVIDGMQHVCTKARNTPPDIRQIIQGDTRVIDAPIERRGAITAMITTKDFRNVIDLRTGSRFGEHDRNLQPPEPLLPRQTRPTVTKWIDADGGALSALNKNAGRGIADHTAATDTQGIAIGLIHAHANRDNECLVVRIVTDQIPDALISLSPEVSPRMHEYEQFDTVIASTCRKPSTKSVFGRLGKHPADMGAACDVFPMHPGGGIMSQWGAGEVPDRLVEAGPAGGAVLAAHIVVRRKLDPILSFDMGGTTAKICPLRDGAFKTAMVFEVTRTYRFDNGLAMPISIPVIDMVKTGFGGRSPAHIYGIHQISIGPESAGFTSGAASYRRGATRPAVIHVGLVLGRLDAQEFAGGTTTPDIAAADIALAKHRATGLEMNAQITTFGLSGAVASFNRCTGPGNILAGEIYVTSDPREGACHLHDAVTVTPSFRHDTLIRFLDCIAHVVDIGGHGFGADAASTFGEGPCPAIMKFAPRGTVDETLLKIVRGSFRQHDEPIENLDALAGCNKIGHHRPIAMMDEIALPDRTEIAAFIFGNPRRATLDRIAAPPRHTATGETTADGCIVSNTSRVTLGIESDCITGDSADTSEFNERDVNCPFVYAKANVRYVLKCAIGPEKPINAVFLAPFEVRAPEDTIANARHPAPVGRRHIVGHSASDAPFATLGQILPDLVRSESARFRCNFQMSLCPGTDVHAPEDARRAEALTFSFGNAGARPTLDGPNATAFPSVVMTEPIEATERAGPVIIWRRESCLDSGGKCRHRGGLGQSMQITKREGREFHLSAMLVRVDHPVRSGGGGDGDGAPTVIERVDGTPMRGKRRQCVAQANRVRMAFPGRGDYSPPGDRNFALIRREAVSRQAWRTDTGRTPTLSPRFKPQSPVAKMFGRPS